MTNEMIESARIGNVFLEQQKYDSAVYHSEKSLYYARLHGNENLIRDNYRLLADIYMKEGRISSYIRTADQYIRLLDSTFANTQYLYLKDLEFSTINNRNQQKINALEDEKFYNGRIIKMQNKVIGISISVSLIVILLLLYVWRQKKQEEQKKLLYPYFEVITTQKESDVYLLLDTYRIDAIMVQELETPEKEIALIKNLKNNDKYKDIPLILINEEKNPELKAKALEINIDEYLEAKFEVDSVKWHIDNAIQKKQDEIKLKKDLKKSNNEIENVYDFLYSSLVHLTAYKSKETGAHLLRTKEYMKRMLKEYENFYHEGQFVDEKTIEDIAIAATLHDIGKVGIPDNILNKPGKLTDEEYEIIKQHVVIGRDTLEGTYGNKLSNNVLQYAKDIVYHHHEKFDGTGYPEGLKNDEITTICKIMAVIDVYDALVNDRVYKKAMPYEEAEQYIIEQSGKAFDPKAINIFRIVKDDLRKINDENQDK